jgi:hypothetical protein
MLSGVSGANTARTLLRDGFVPLTPETARHYVLGLGASPDEADAAATALIAGEASVLTDVVLRGKVERKAMRANAGRGSIQHCRAGP